MKAIYWTLGQYDLAVICEGPDDAGLHGRPPLWRRQAARSFRPARPVGFLYPPIS